jgi:hypothetical protein
MAKAALAIVPDDDDLTVTGSPRCRGIKADGTRCGSFRGRSGYCFNHDPNVDRAAKFAARGRGGRNSSRAVRAQRMLPPRLRPVFERLERAMDEVVEGTISPTRATALASLASASVRVLEAGEMEERLRRMETATGDEEDAPPPGGYDDE